MARRAWSRTSAVSTRHAQLTANTGKSHGGVVFVEAVVAVNVSARPVRRVQLQVVRVLDQRLRDVA